MLEPRLKAAVATHLQVDAASLSLSPLPSYADTVFTVHFDSSTGATRPPVLLKVVHTTSSQLAVRARLLNQRDAIAHVASAGGVRTAGVIADSHGATVFEVPLGENHYLLQLFEFVPGPLLHSLLHLPTTTTAQYLRMCRSLGSALGSLDRELQCWRAPTCARVPTGALDTLATTTPARGSPEGSELRAIGEWDLRAVPALASALPFVSEKDGLRDGVAAALEETRALLVPLYQRSAAAAAAVTASSHQPAVSVPIDDAALRMQWIHGDANDMNVIVSPVEGGLDHSTAAAAAAVAAADPSRLTFVDWDDSSFGFLVHDPAIAIAYLMMAGGAAEPSAVASALIHGYTGVLALRESEIRVIPALVRSRLAASLLMSSRESCAEGVSPEKSAYVLVHAAPAANLLRRLQRGGGSSGHSQAASDAALVDAMMHASGLLASHASPEPARSYSSFPGPLPNAQLAASAAVVAGLAGLGARGRLHPSVRLGDPDSLPPAKIYCRSSGTAADDACAAAPRAAGFIPSTVSPAWTRLAAASAAAAATVGAGCAAAAAEAAGVAGVVVAASANAGAASVAAAPPGALTSDCWCGPAPFVFDWGWGNSALAEFVGTERARLRLFSASGAAAVSGSREGGPVPGFGEPVRLGWGRYGEVRSIYQSEHFRPAGASRVVDDDGGCSTAPAFGGAGEECTIPQQQHPPLEARTVHLGVDIGAPAGTAVRSPLAGVIHSFRRNLAELDYGPTVILQHRMAIGWGAVGCSDDATGDDAPVRAVEDAGASMVVFYTLWGHLTLSSICTPDGQNRFRVGDPVPAGSVIGWVGSEDVNGGWPPHLHVQVNTELDHGGWRGDYPGVCTRSDWRTYKLLCPDPNLLLRCPFVEPVGWDPLCSGATVGSGLV